VPIIVTVGRLEGGLDARSLAGDLNITTVMAGDITARGIETVDDAQARDGALAVALIE
jgi:hypothetical protein